MQPQPNNPLHGLTLKAIVEHLVEKLGWQAMANAVPIRCFESNPSVKSSLTFLRKTPWAREKVEQLYLAQQGITSVSTPHRAKKSPPPSQFQWPTKPLKSPNKA